MGLHLMASDVALIVFASLLLSVTIAYAWWVKVRVVRLREDLFQIRDRLFDLALARGRLNDSGYRRAREHINAVIRMAGTVSIPTVLFTAFRCTSSAGPIKADDPELQETIDRAMDQLVQRVTRYLIRETLTGLAASFVALLIPRSVVHQAARRGVNKCLDSGAPEVLGPMIKMS